MCSMDKKNQVSASQTVFPNDCYAQKVKAWIWLLVIVVIGAMICTIVAFPSQKPVESSSNPTASPSIQVQNVASVPCPYCPGFLDNQGRCNIFQCPVYGPNWGKSSSRQRSSLGQILIKELALEVKPSDSTGGVDIHAIYIGGNGEKAGLRAGDRIFRFNGRRVKDVEQFQSLVAQAKPETNVRTQVIRNKKKIKMTVMIGEGEMEGVTIPIK